MMKLAFPKKNRLLNPIWGCLIGIACLGIGCNESVNSESLHSESVLGGQTEEVSAAQTQNGTSNVQVVPQNKNDESHDAHQDSEPQTDAGGHHAEPADDSHEDTESENQTEPDKNNHEESDHRDNSQAASDGTGTQADSGDNNDAPQIPAASDNEIADSGDNESSVSDAETPPTHEWAQPIEAVGLPNLFKVNEDVYRSAQPESGGFESAEKLGIKTILSVRLTANDAVLAQNEPTSLTLIHIPLVPIYITTDEMLEVMKAFDGAEKPILVHCQHGADRTGLTIALYRILYEGWSKEEAKDELVNGGFGYHSVFVNILEFIDELDMDSFKSQLSGD